MSSAVKIRVISARDLAPVEITAWSALQEADASLASPFFRPEFTAAMASVRNDVFVGVLERAGRCIGFFPFQRDEQDVGTPVGGLLSDYHGVIAEPGLEWNAQRMIGSCGLKEWRFDHLLAAQTPFQVFHRVETSSPVIDVSEGYAAYVTQRRRAGSEQIKKTMGLRRKLEREKGAIRFDLHSLDPAMLRTLMRWKSQQYVSSGKQDLFALPWVVNLIERLPAMQGEHFAGLLTVLFAGNQAIAAHLGMRSRTQWHYWLPAYDPNFAKYSPGLILLLYMAEQAAAMGIRSMDLGKGKALYKRRLASHTVPLVEGTIYASGFQAALNRMRGEARLCFRQSPIFKPLRSVKRFFRRLREEKPGA